MPTPTVAAYVALYATNAAVSNRRWVGVVEEETQAGVTSLFGEKGAGEGLGRVRPWRRGRAGPAGGAGAGDQ
jgi:hypothetical protein